MPEIEDVLKTEDFKSKAAAIGAGVLVIIAGFLVYNYFSKVGSEGELYGEAVIEEQNEDEGVQVVPSEKEQAEKTEESNAPQKEGQEGSVQNTSEWQATDYEEGDISSEVYTVARGDTLWEIAEARYGSGFEWTKILNANKDSIGYLSNGSQALIEVGQTLNLP